MLPSRLILFMLPILVCLVHPLYSSSITDAKDKRMITQKDTTLVNKLNHQALRIHRKYPDSANHIARQSLRLDSSLDYTFGIAEANFVLGMTLLSQFLIGDSTANCLDIALNPEYALENLLHIEIASI